MEAARPSETLVFVLQQYTASQEDLDFKDEWTDG
jgi:hypothetical protein